MLHWLAADGGSHRMLCACVYFLYQPMPYLVMNSEHEISHNITWIGVICNEDMHKASKNLTLDLCHLPRLTF